MDGKAEADAEEARYVQSKPPLGPEGGPQGIRTDIRPGHGESDISRLLRLCCCVVCVDCLCCPPASDDTYAMIVAYVRCG